MENPRNEASLEAMNSSAPRAGMAKEPEIQTVYVVLPAFNEEARIGRLLDRIKEAMRDTPLEYKIIVVDDGSRDSTASIVRERSSQIQVSLIRHSRNLGLGAAIRDGFTEALRHARADDVIVTMDADDTQPPDLIPTMLRRVHEGCDVVVASRYRPDSRVVGVPLGRRILSYIASFLFRGFFPTPGLRDYTCGYRVYRAEVLRTAIENYGEEFLDQEGFQCMVDILLKLRKMNWIFGEVPLILRYDFKEGGTKMNIVLTVRKTLHVMFRAMLSP